MLIQVSVKGFDLSSELRSEVEEKIESALEHFCSRIGRVNVFLADVNGPKKGIDKSLRIIIDLDRLPLIVLEEKGESWQAMLDRSAERAAYSVSRQVERIRARSDRTSMSGDGAADEVSAGTEIAGNDNVSWNGMDDSESIEMDCNPLRTPPRAHE